MADQEPREVRCPNCDRLLIRAAAVGVVWPYCKTPKCRREVRIELKE